MNTSLEDPIELFLFPLRSFLISLAPRSFIVLSKKISQIPGDFWGADGAPPNPLCQQLLQFGSAVRKKNPTLVLFLSLSKHHTNQGL